MSFCAPTGEFLRFHESKKKTVKTVYFYNLLKLYPIGCIYRYF